jgi:hypothetical protein
MCLSEFWKGRFCHTVTRKPFPNHENVKIFRNLASILIGYIQQKSPIAATPAYSMRDD